MDLPKHDGGLLIEHQPHRRNYETVEDWAAWWLDGAAPDRLWVSEEQRALATAQDSLWIVQWYPDTPVGFYLLAGADLDVLLARACEISPAQDKE